MAVFLIVDDETHIRNMLKKALEELEYEADSVANGEEALRALFEKRYDGLFTDLKMPGMNGLDLLKAMNEETITIPKVVVSVCTEADKIIQCFQLGIMNYITKPFTPEEIKAAAKQMLKLKIDIKETTQYVKGLIQQNALSSAEKYMSKLFSAYPSSPIPHYLYGLKNLKEGDLAKSLKHLKASLSLDESYDPAKRQLEEIKVMLESKTEEKEKKGKTDHGEEK